MHISRRAVALMAAVILSSCGSNSSNVTGGSVPQLVTTDATTSLRSIVAVDKASGLALPATTSSLASGEIPVGPGFSDVSPHQIVRTSNNVVYVAVPSCNSYPLCYGNSIGMQAGNKSGTPTSFEEKDSAHNPSTSASAKDGIGSSAIALAASDKIYVAYNTQSEGTYVASFDTEKNLWGKPVRIGSTSAGPKWSVEQGKEGVGIAVDRNGSPHIVFSYLGSDGVKHIATSHLSSGSWTSAVQIDDAKLGSGQGALHPTVAFSPSNVMLVAWLVGNESAGYNTPDGTIRVRALTSSTSGPPSVQIPDKIYSPNKGYAATTIDQGPSMIVTAAGSAHVAFIDTNDVIRYWHSNLTDYTSWVGSAQPARQQTHDPSLGPDGSGGIYIYGHGTPQGNKDGHGNNLYRMHLGRGSSTWSAFELQIADNNLDCSVSTRWSQFFHYFPEQIDYTYWNDHYPNQEFVTTH